MMPKVKKSLSTGKIDPGTSPHYHAAKAFATFAPLAMTHFAHSQISLKSVFAHDPPCAPCRQLRAVGVQLATGWLQPIIMCLAGISYVVKMETLKMPYEKGQVLSWARKMTQRNKNFLLGTLAAQTLLAAAVNYGQEYQWFKINIELLDRIERDRKLSTKAVEEAKKTN